MSETKRVISQLEKEVESLVAQLNQSLTDNLFDATPVDTGFARSNWIPSIGSPFSSTVGFRAIGSIDRSAQESGKASLSSYKLDQGNVYVSNNVDYIGDLNSGSSRQAPSAFVETTIEQTVAAGKAGVVV